MLIQHFFPSGLILKSHLFCGSFSRTKSWTTSIKCKSVLKSSPNWRIISTKCMSVTSTELGNFYLKILLETWSVDGRLHALWISSLKVCSLSFLNFSRSFCWLKRSYCSKIALCCTKFDWFPVTPLIHFLYSFSKSTFSSLPISSQIDI